MAGAPRMCMLQLIPGSHSQRARPQNSSSSSTTTTSSSSSSSSSSSKMQASQLLDSLIAAFMNAPQVDSRNVRVPVDLSVTSKKARARVHAKQNEGSYCATVPQLPVTTACR